MRLGEMTQKQFLEPSYNSEKSVAISEFVKIQSNFVESIALLLFFLSVVSKCAWAKWRKNSS